MPTLPRKPKCFHLPILDDGYIKSLEGEPFPCFYKRLSSERFVAGGGGYVKNVPVKSVGTYGVLQNLNVSQAV